jgi:dTDP-4-dehydrorhamnose reductase
MKILLLGKNGNLGRGIFHVFNCQNEFELIAPSKGELDLTDRQKTVEYIAKTKPYAVINAAAYTTNKNTNTNEAIKISETNLIVSANLKLAANNCNVFRYIDIGSSSIYESFPKRIITEQDFQAINEYMPTLPYGKAKLIQTKQVIEMDSSDSPWVSLILPYVISFNKPGLRETNGLFARVSKQFIQCLKNEGDLTFLNSVDTTINRQFVHSIDVGHFCRYLLKDNSVHGLVHMPNLQQMSLNYFLQKHLERIPAKIIETFEEFSYEVQHPELRSVWEDLTEFSYEFTPEKCVDSLLNYELGK